MSDPETSEREVVEDGFITLLQAIHGEGVPVEDWDGDEEVFNHAKNYPGIFVIHAGIDFGENTELGDEEATYERAHLLEVRYCVASTRTEKAGRPAKRMLEKSEKGVVGKTVAGLGQAMLIHESLLKAYLGQLLYVQIWRVELLASN